MQGWNRGTRKRRKGEEEKRIKAEKWEKIEMEGNIEIVGIMRRVVGYAGLPGWAAEQHTQNTE